MDEPKLKTVEFEGFKFEFDPNNVDDMEFLELTDLVETDKDVTKFPALTKMLMGEENYKRACEYFKEKYGKFTASKCAELFKCAINNTDPKE